MMKLKLIFLRALLLFLFIILFTGCTTENSNLENKESTGAELHDINLDEKFPSATSDDALNEESKKEPIVNEIKISIELTKEIYDKASDCVKNYEPNTGKSASISINLTNSDNVKKIDLSGGNQYIKCINTYKTDNLIYIYINIQSSELNYVEFYENGVIIYHNSTVFTLMNFGNYDWSKFTLKEEEIQEKFEKLSAIITTNPSYSCREIQRFNLPLDLISGKIFEVR
ncbi:MAG: hypothetical protein KAI55_02735 [Candidatus Aenigmarchaeota archaeon]|nr:hypothetical protein [Candidatus Aenigmarchaeota archaeon]